MLTSVPPTDCMSAREAVSLRLDGELSELEAARLDAHLAGCAECRVFAAEIASTAVVLRAAPLEQPRAAIVLGRRRRLPTPAAGAAAASILLAVTASSFALGHVLGAHSSAPQAALAANDVAQVRQDSAHQHLLVLLNAFEPRRRGLSRMRAI